MRWPLQPLQPFQKTQLQPPFGPSVDSLCHPWFTITNLSYRFCILKLPPPRCAVLLVIINWKNCDNGAFERIIRGDHKHRSKNDSLRRLQDVSSGRTTYWPFSGLAAFQVGKRLAPSIFFTFTTCCTFRLFFALNFLIDYDGLWGVTWNSMFFTGCQVCSYNWAESWALPMLAIQYCQVSSVRLCAEQFRKLCISWLSPWRGGTIPGSCG